MQRHIVLGRQPRREAKGRSWAGMHRPGTAEALSLAKYRLASRWQPLIWFWSSILAITVTLGLILAALGPPSERVADAEPAPEAVQAPRPTPAAMPAQVARRVELERPPAVSVPMRPEPDRPTPPTPGVQPPGAAAQPVAPPRPRAVLMLHPARSEGSAAIASRLAAQTGLAPDQVDVGSVAEARSDAVIRFYSTSDHPLARRLGKELARMGYSWRIENFAERSWAWKDQAVEVYLPDR